jgi:hypothetical protein
MAWSSFAALADLWRELSDCPSEQGHRSIIRAHLMKALAAGMDEAAQRAEQIQQERYSMIRNGFS